MCRGCLARTSRIGDHMTHIQSRLLSAGTESRGAAAAAGGSSKARHMVFPSCNERTVCGDGGRWDLLRERSEPSFIPPRSRLSQLSCSQ